jgi:NAD(P)-dependent dehydrogenase (short-subunit alcohol dehydrogenase family)
VVREMPKVWQAFLADPTRSGFINGVALPVDGGWTADASWTALRLRKRRT